MRIDPEHIGKTLRYGDGEPFILEGFEKEGDSLYVYGVSTGRGGAKPNQPKYKDKQYYNVTVAALRNNWEFVEDNGIFNFTKFGCNASHMKELIEVLDKRYVKVSE